MNEWIGESNELDESQNQDCGGKDEAIMERQTRLEERNNTNVHDEGEGKVSEMAGRGEREKGDLTIPIHDTH